MVLEVLSSSIAAVAALGTAEQVIAAAALVFDLAALVAVRHFLGVRRPAPTGAERSDFREAA